jgi:hypothetical protein
LRNDEAAKVEDRVLRACFGNAGDREDRGNRGCDADLSHGSVSSMTAAAEVVTLPPRGGCA